MTNFKYDDISYLTQYADLLKNDQDVLNQFNYWLKVINDNELQNHYKNEVIKINNNMSNVHDDINQKICWNLLGGDTNIENLKQYNVLLKTLGNEDIWNQSDQNLKYGMSAFMSENDYALKEDMLEIIDQDFKENGINSQYIYSFNSSSALNNEYGDYVYIDPYLQMHNKDIKDIEEEYIENLASLKLDEIIDLNNKESIDSNNNEYQITSFGFFNSDNEESKEETNANSLMR